MLASQRMNHLPLLLLILAACCGCTGTNQPGPVQPPAVKMSVEAHRQNLEGMLYQFELAWLQNGAGSDTQSAFSKVAEPYIDSISDISTLEKLYFSLSGASTRMTTRACKPGHTVLTSSITTLCAILPGREPARHMIPLCASNNSAAMEPGQARSVGWSGNTCVPILRTRGFSNLLAAFFTEPPQDAAPMYHCLVQNAR